MRELTDHVVSRDQAVQLKIEVTDEPGAGGANYRYEITGFDTQSNPSRPDSARYAVSYFREVILFQNGPIKEAGVNGITQEALLAIVIDRLRSFQRGPYPSDSNQKALDHAMLSLSFLQDRTRERIKRGVEGTHQA